jgi:hypothetical protein
LAARIFCAEREHLEQSLLLLLPFALPLFIKYIYYLKLLLLFCFMLCYVMLFYLFYFIVNRFWQKGYFARNGSTSSNPSFLSFSFPSHCLLLYYLKLLLLFYFISLIVNRCWQGYFARNGTSSNPSFPPSPRTASFYFILFLLCFYYSSLFYFILCYFILFYFILFY